MGPTASPDGTRRWQLTGARAVTFWVPIVVLPVLVVGGIVAIATNPDTPPGFLVVWSGVLVFVGAQFLRQATAVEIDTAGTVRLYRPLLPDVSVHVDDVRRLGLGPVLRRVGVATAGAPRHVEYQVEGRTRRVPLAAGLPGLFELGTALREHAPDIEIDLG